MTSIAIVGVGAIYPGAGSAPEFWRNILAGVDAITDVPPHRWDPEVYYDPRSHAKPESGRFYCRRGGFIDELALFDPATFGIMPAAVDGIEPDQLLALRTAAEAIADAGGDSALPDRSRIGVIIGRGGYISPGQARLDQRATTAHQLAVAIRDLIPDLGDEQVELIRQAFLDKLGGGQPDASIGVVPNFVASRIANRFDFRGPAYAVDAACTSSLLALEQAVRMLESGHCDAMLAGAVHHAHHATVWSVFTQLKALSVTERIRPFDARADGTLLSEGTGMLLLKRLDDALGAGDRIYAVVRGVGASSDGRASSLMSPLADGQVLAVERAWQDAGLDPRAPGALGLVEAHGTATPVGDQVELETLRRVFGTEGPEIGLGTVKSMIGHSMPAAGMAGLIKAAYALHDQVLPPTLVEEPHPALAGGRLRLVTEVREWPSGSEPRRAGINAFGFGGANAHVVLEEPPARSRRTARRRAESRADGEPVLRLSAEDIAGLADLLARPDKELVGLATCDLDYLKLPAPTGCRIAIVAPDPRRLELARTIVARGTAWRGRSDIWFSPAPMLANAGKTAFLFPGFEPVFEPRVDDIADHFGLARPELTGRTDLVGHASDVFAVGRTLADALGELGIVPDTAAGHSVGEWTAMMATGMYPRAALAEFIEALDRTALEVPDVVYAALGCGAERAGAAIAGLDGVVVSHDNCPHQSVICGPPGPIRQALDRLWGEGVLGQELPFRSGFHTPMAEVYRDTVLASFLKLPLHRTEIPVWSGTTADRFPQEPEEIRQLIVRHMLEPVRFGELVRRLHEEGVRAFVQVGPGSLTGFVGDALADPAREHLALPVNVAKRDGMAQLARVVAALWAEGYGKARPAGVRLNLGSPLVRLDGIPLALSRPEPERAAGPPLMAEFDALLRDATATARTVLDAYTASTARTELTTRRVFSVAAMPYLMDHCLIPQRAGWPEVSDRFPVVPLTTLLEVMADTARELVPDSVVIGFEKVRALRWVVAEPATTATVRANLVEPGRVEVVIEGHTEGTVLVADRYPRPAAPDRTPLIDEIPAPIPAHRFYSERWMFHGPRYQGVTGLGTIARNGLRATLTTPAAPGALMDSAGQLCGHWIQVYGEKDQTVFPVGIDRVTWYGPPPPEAERLELTVWNRAISDTTIKCDAEMVDTQGRVWGRIDGWTTHRFYTDPAVWRMKFTPEVSGVGEPQDGGWVLARRRWDNGSARDLLMRQYLCAPERAEYERLSPRAQGPWLLGRIAVKDAVRNRLWDRGHGPLFPAELRVRDDVVTGPFDGQLRVAVAVNPEVAGAAVAPTAVDLAAEIERDAPEGGVVTHQRGRQHGG